MGTKDRRLLQSLVTITEGRDEEEDKVLREAMRTVAKAVCHSRRRG